MDFYENRKNAIKMINEMINQKKEVRLNKLIYAVSINFGFSKRFVIDWISQLQENGEIIRENDVIRVK